MNNYLILFASNGNNIGKTTTASRLSYFLYENLNKKIKDSKDYDEWLSNTDYNTQIKSFATPIRDISNSFFKILFNGQNKITFEKLYQRENKNRPLKDFFPEDAFNACPDYKEYTIRDIVNIFSDQIQLISSEYIWADYALKDINNFIRNYSNTNNILIYDDFRRPLEYFYLKEHLENFKIITVYLDKENPSEQVQTNYEGLLKDFNFTITFTFKNDYSNIHDLFSLILKEIK